MIRVGAEGVVGICSEMNLLFAAPELKIQHPLPGAPDSASGELRRARAHPAAAEQRVRGLERVATAGEPRDAETRQERVRSAIAGADGGGRAEQRRGAGPRHDQDAQVYRRVVAAAAA